MTNSALLLSHAALAMLASVATCSVMLAPPSRAAEPRRMISTSPPPSYCRRWPDRCSLGVGCSPEGCEPISWVCCSESGGCVAVHESSDCDADLYWLDCEAGESTIDPASGLPTVLCHDPE